MIFQKVETVTDFILLGSKFTLDSDCSHKIKTLAPWKKSYDKPRQCIKKQRCPFVDKGPYSQSYDSSSMYRCGSWTIKKTEQQRVDASELWCWRRLLRVPWTARRSNQSVLKEINPEYSLEELMLKLQSFGHMMQSADALKKTVMLRKTEGRRRREQQRMRCLDGITVNGPEFEQTQADSKGQGSQACYNPWGHKETDTT